MGVPRLIFPPSSWISETMTVQVQTFPPWIRRAWPSGESFSTLKRMLDAGGLHTVCQSAHCPNQSECWARGTATFMVLGNLCTRHCSYCAVNSGHPEAVEDGEPERRKRSRRWACAMWC